MAQSSDRSHSKKHNATIKSNTRFSIFTSVSQKPLNVVQFITCTTFFKRLFPHLSLTQFPHISHFFQRLSQSNPSKLSLKPKCMRFCFVSSLSPPFTILFFLFPFSRLFNTRERNCTEKDRTFLRLWDWGEVEQVKIKSLFFLLSLTFFFSVPIFLIL